MKKMKRMAALVLALMMTLALVSCGGKSGSGSTGSGDGLIYAVESGSAGEGAALEKGWDVNAVSNQAAALMEVSSGTSDKAIIDLLMASAMIGEGTSYPDLVLGEELTEEAYGVGCRKDSDLADFINSVFYELYADGTMEAVAEQYGVQSALVEQQEAKQFAPSGDTADTSDVRYIQEKGKLLVGTTEFAPLDYRDEHDQWIGFDADMARLVAEKLGVDIEFVEIEWDNKLMELDSGSVDVLWNGMTLTDEVLNGASCTVPYCRNAQVVVEPAA